MLGGNAYGQLGLGDAMNRGTTMATMGDNLLAVSLGDGLVVRSLALGGHHTCALFENGRVKCWGRNDTGQLGLGLSDNRGDGANEMGNALPFVDLGTGIHVTAIAAGSAHTCALLESGFVKCWGYGARGQLGFAVVGNWGDEPNEMGNMLPIIDADNGQKVVAIAAAGDHTCALLQDGRMKCWGANVAGLHNCAALADGSLRCWGYNASGQLGLGNTSNQGEDAGEMSMLPEVRPY